MKRIICGIILCLSTNVLYAKPLTSFADITQQLSHGNTVSILLDVAKCHVNNPNEEKIPLAKWLLKPNTFGFSDTLITADSFKFASGRPPFPDSGLLQRGSVLLDNNGQAKTIVSFYNAETNQKFMKDVEIQCQLNEGLQFFTA